MDRRFGGILTDAGYLLLAAVPALRRVYRHWALPRYERLAGGYASHVRADASYLVPLRSILDALPSAPSTILDIGAGTGAATALLARRYPTSSILALDASPAMLRQFESRSGGAHLVIGDAFALPVRTGSVDLIVVHNAPFDLGALMRALAPAGVAAVILSSARGVPAPLRSWCLRRSGADGWPHSTYAAGAGLAVIFRRPAA